MPVTQVDVPGSILRGMEGRNYLAQMRDAQQQRQDRNALQGLFAERYGGRDPNTGIDWNTGRQGPGQQMTDQAFVGRAMAIDPQAGMDLQKHMSGLRKDQLETSKAEAPLIVGALRGVADQTGWDRAKNMLGRAGVDTSDMPSMYSPELHRQTLQVAQHLMGEGGKAPQVETFFDEETGQPYKARWNPQTGEYERVGGVKTDVLSPQAEAQKARIAQAGASKTEMKLPEEEKQYDKTIGEFYATTFADMQKAGSSAAAQNARLNRAKQLVMSVRTGAAQPTIQLAKSWARDLGMDLESIGVTDDTPAADAMRAIGSEIALDAVQRTKGPVSDREMDLFLEMAPSLATSAGGNLLIIEMAQELNRRSAQVAKLARDYATQNNGRLDAGFYDKLAEFHEANPLFTEDLTKRIDAVRKESKAEDTKTIDGKTYDLIDGVWFER